MVIRSINYLADYALHKRINCRAEKVVQCIRYLHCMVQVGSLAQHIVLSREKVVNPEHSSLTPKQKIRTEKTIISLYNAAFGQVKKSTFL